jgi:hypothetical protein
MPHDRIFNSGHIIVKTGNTKTRISLKLNSDGMIFSVGQKNYIVRNAGDGYLIKDYQKQHQMPCKNLRGVISYITKTPSNKIKILDSKFSIKDIPFTLLLLSNGIMLKLELEFWPQTFVIMNIEPCLFVAHKQGEWEKPVITNEDVMRNCTDYNDAMAAIYDYCRPNINSLIAIPHIIN